MHWMMLYMAPVLLLLHHYNDYFHRVWSTKPKSRLYCVGKGELFLMCKVPGWERWAPRAPFQRLTPLKKNQPCMWQGENFRHLIFQRPFWPWCCEKFVSSLRNVFRVSMKILGVFNLWTVRVCTAPGRLFSQHLGGRLEIIVLSKGNRMRRSRLTDAFIWKKILCSLLVLLPAKALTLSYA